ncbi:hypothetical protein QTL86_19245 [Cellulosilyticum sp. ST5]|uniref:hypothetical protein n=1 Tax=Cellulosilyticum sp. ST5 TaxID=3055805 RepID=UPI003977C08E
MKKRVGFIAVGQAGGNIGSALEKNGWNVLFLNTSTEDLDTLTKVKYKYHIKGGEGCNKDRNKAKELVVEDFKQLASEISSKVPEEFIYVIFSSGGGTGSGASPMLIDLLVQHMDKKVGAITIIPGENEPFKTHINSYECFRELADIEMASTIVLDNNSFKNKMIINQEFVKAFEEMMDMPTHTDVRGNIDKAEMKELIETRGMLTINKVEKAESTAAKLVESFKKNIYAPIEADKVIKYIGLLLAKPLEITDIKKEVGNYLDVFQGHHSEYTLCVLAGLSLPFTRLQDIKEKVKESQEDIKKNLKATSVNKLNEEIDFLSSSSSASNKQSKSNANDIFAKYRKK